MKASILNKQKAHLLLNVGGNYPDAPLILVICNDVRKQFKHNT